MNIIGDPTMTNIIILQMLINKEAVNYHKILRISRSVREQYEINWSIVAVIRSAKRI